MKWRHEYKYVSPETILQVIESRVRAVMMPDFHASRGKYSIRSVYFDDMYDTCFKENEDGVDPRRKWRIRIYNASREHITLEMKKKEKGKTLKLSCPINEALCNELLCSGQMPSRYARFAPAKRLAFDCGKQESARLDEPLLRQFIAEMQYRALRPVCVVCYERAPYVCSAGNVRVTFDRNIRSSQDAALFFCKNAAFRPVLPCGMNMMEVKYDEFIPDYLAQMLETGALVYSSFSKYALCRRYAAY